MNPQQLIFSAILLTAVALLVTERLRPDLIAILIIIALYATRILNPEEALAGFSAEPAIVIASVFVLSAAFRATGLSDILSGWISRLAGGGYARILLVAMPAAALMSAPTHHVTVTAIMLPVMLALAAAHSIAPSKLLMPITIASSLGTTITILGAPSFLVSSELLQQAGRPGLGVLSIAPIGLALTVLGTAFMILIGRFLLPERKGGQDPTGHFRLEEYYTELAIPPDSSYVGKTPEQLKTDGGYKLDVLGWVRDGQRLSGSLESRPMAAGDVLLVRTTPDELATFQKEAGLELKPIEQYGVPTPDGKEEGGAAARDEAEKDVEERLAQAVIAPGASLVGRTLSGTDFRRAYDAVVVGLWRQRPLPAAEMARIPLRAGDVLVLQGDPDALGKLARDPDFLLLAPFQGEGRRRTKALLAALIMLGTIALAAFDVMTIGLAAVTGATAMVLTRCLSGRQALRAIDAQMYLFLAGAIPLGTAMSKTGTAKLVATWLQALVSGWNQSFVLVALFLTVGVIVQFMGSDSATVALFAPVGIALAQLLNRPPEVYVVTIAMAAVTAVLTPMSHHNLLIYRPGGYRFFDYVRVGVPLTIGIAIVVALMTPLVFRG